MQPAGHIDEIGERISGWAFDPQQRLVALVLDKTVIPITPTIQRPDVVQVGAAPASLVGFSIPLTDVLAQWRSADPRAPALPKILALMAGSACVDLRQLPSAKSLTGRLEAYRHGGYVSGWVKSSSDFAPEIEIAIDGIEWARVAADQPPAEHAPAGSRGFRCPLPSTPSRSMSFEIAARISLSGRQLENSPLRVDAWPRSHVLEHVSQVIGNGDCPPVTIVIPVHNAPDDLKRCLDSVLMHTTSDARLLVIDDASTHRAVGRILDGLTTADNIEVVRNPANLGFAATVNKALKLSESSDVVLLNSDTVVPPRWLENLRFAAYAHPTTATATALSNNAGAFSAPEPNVENIYPDSLDPQSIGRLMMQESLGLLPEAPTGNGFCMYIKRSCLIDVGEFDARAFSRGYGEENDFCMRALRAGWRHVVDDRTFVMHARSASFGGEREKLAEAARHTLNSRYPEYPLLVRSFFKDSNMVLARHRVRRALAEVGRRRPLPRLLTVISSSSGGTPQTNADLARALSNGYEVYVLTSDRRRIALSRILDGRQQPIAEHILSAPLTLARHFSSEYDSLIASWLVEFAIEMVHIRHIGWHGLGLPWVCRQLGIPVVLSFHDFYLICPSVKLLDEKLRYCGGTCTAGPGPCAAELWNPEDTPALKHEWVNVWRQQTAAMLEAVDGFVASSEGARQTILANFLEIDDRAFEVIPHGRDFKSFSSSAVKPNSARPIRVLAPGNLSIAKGANILAELDALDRDRRLDIHTMGDISAPLVRDSLHHHGKYERDDFVGLVKKIKPSFGLILSLWPETFCHTLTELRAAGIPVIAFDMGAVAERIRAEGGGVLVQERSAAAIYRAILETTADPKTYDALLADIRQWQAGHGRDHDTKAMADRYSRFYSAILDGRRSFRLPVSR